MTAERREKLGLLEIMLEDKKIEILVERRGDKYKYSQVINDGKSRSLGVYSKSPKSFSNLIEEEYQSRGIDIKERRYTPYSYSTN
jgi:hypothetical protein